MGRRRRGRPPTIGWLKQSGRSSRTPRRQSSTDALPGTPAARRVQSAVAVEVLQDERLAVDGHPLERGPGLARPLERLALGRAGEQGVDGVEHRTAVKHWQPPEGGISSDWFMVAVTRVLRQVCSPVAAPRQWLVVRGRAAARTSTDPVTCSMRARTLGRRSQRPSCSTLTTYSENHAR